LTRRARLLRGEEPEMNLKIRVQLAQDAECNLDAVRNALQREFPDHEIIIMRGLSTTVDTNDSLSVEDYIWYTIIKNA
jgi:hypothetical protein